MCRKLAAPAAAALAAGLTACASTQEVRVACVPETVEVYVDGRLLEDPHQTVDLRADRPHKIYVKGPGFEPHLVVLEPHPGPDGSLQLAGESDLCVDLVPVGMGRELDLDVEEELPEAPRPR